MGSINVRPQPGGRKRSGAATLERYGLEHFARMGALGGKVVREKYGATHYEEIGRKGGTTTAKRGSEFYREIGRMGGRAGKGVPKTRRDNIEQA